MQKEGILIPPERMKPLVVGNTVYRSPYDYQLTDSDLKRAQSELRETKDVKNVALQKLREKLSGDEDALYRIEEHYLLRYLRYEKFRSDKAYGMLRTLYKLRTEHPELFSLPSNLEFVLGTNFFRILPFRDESGSIIFWFDARKWKLADLSPQDGLKVINVVGDLYALNPSCQIHGLVEIWDMRNLSAVSYAKMLYPSTLKLIFKTLQECYPWRIKRIVLLYCNSMVRSAFNVLRYFIKDKVADRVVILGSDLSELHQYVNPSLLPKEYGGSIEESECNSMKNFALENMSYMKYERSFKLIR